MQLFSRRPLALALAVALFLPVAALPALRAQDKPVAAPTEVLTQLEGGVQVLVLDGTDRERGIAHGRALAQQILVAAGELEKVKKQVFKAPEAHAAMLAKFKWPDAVKAELDGIIEGVRQVLPDGKVPGTTRAIERADLEGFNTIADLLPFACSSFTVTGDRVEGGGTLTGRNLDYPPFESMLPIRLVIVHKALGDRRGYATIGWPGIVGVYTGMNDQGVTASIHDVRTGKETLNRKDFTPRAVGLRHVLERTAAGEGFVQRAAEVLRGEPVIYGNNIHVSAPRVGDALPAAILEWGPERDDEKGVTVRLTEGAAPLICTNHWRSRKEPIHCRRYAALEKALGGKEKLTPESALELLRVSNVHGGVLTVHSVVLAPDARLMLCAFARSTERGAAFETPVKVELAKHFGSATMPVKAEKTEKAEKKLEKVWR